jgi:hypothetical protein
LIASTTLEFDVFAGAYETRTLVVNHRRRAGFEVRLFPRAGVIA